MKVAHPMMEFEIYPVTPRRRLPRFRVPLRPRDKDVLLDLQAVLDQCYANGRMTCGSTTRSRPIRRLAKRIASGRLRWSRRARRIRSCRS